MKHTLFALLLILSVLTMKGQSNDQPQDPKVIISTICHLDSLFWDAYNHCDVEKMSAFFTDDIEFYHDKGGATFTKERFVQSIKKGMCGNPAWRLRREPLPETVKVFPMNNYGGLISGEHIFYITETGKKEYLDGYGKFTQLWQYKNNEWKMSRVLSYDHGPAPYRNARKEITIAPKILKQYAGRYQSAQAGTVDITVDQKTLQCQGMTLFPESNTKFFAKERDLQCEFVTEKNKVMKMIVYEKGNAVDEAKRLE